MTTAARPTDIRIEALEYGYEDFLYRTPIKFGGVALDRCTLLNVHCTVRTASGRTARGFGSMPLGNVWSFPSRVLGSDQTLRAMSELAKRVREVTAGCTEAGHPIALPWAVEPESHKAPGEVSGGLNPPEPIPALCTLVVASPFD